MLKIIIVVKFVDWNMEYVWSKYDFVVKNYFWFFFRFIFRELIKSIYWVIIVFCDINMGWKVFVVSSDG